VDYAALQALLESATGREAAKTTADELEGSWLRSF